VAGEVIDMNMEEIERQVITVTEYDEPCVGLAEEAKQVLGYDILKTAIEKPNERTQLELALAAAGIEVLNPEHVKTYQTEMLKERSKILFAEWLKTTDPSSFWGPRWDKTPIEDYKQPIPEFVLNKAIQIKKAVPDVRIYVEHLSEHPDPFLVVAMKHKDYSFDGETHYIEVWAEPKFEGRVR